MSGADAVQRPRPRVVHCAVTTERAGHARSARRSGPPRSPGHLCLRPKPASPARSSACSSVLVVSTPLATGVDGVQRDPGQALRHRVADVVEMWCLATDHDTQSDDGVVVAGELLRHHRNLDRAEHADHRRVVDAPLGGQFAGAGQQRIADLGVPGACDDAKPQTGRVSAGISGTPAPPLTEHRRIHLADGQIRGSRPARPGRGPSCRVWSSGSGCSRRWPAPAAAPAR